MLFLSEIGTTQVLLLSKRGENNLSKCQTLLTTYMLQVLIILLRFFCALQQSVLGRNWSQYNNSVIALMQNVNINNGLSVRGPRMCTCEGLQVLACYVQRCYSGYENMA